MKLAPLYSFASTNTLCSSRVRSSETTARNSGIINRGKRGAAKLLPLGI